MKNRYILIIIGVFIILLIMILFDFQKYMFNEIDNDIIGKTWYRYDTSGYYDVININENEIVYKSANDDEKINCTSYSFDKKEISIKLDCGNNIKINKVMNDRIILSFDNKQKVFFDNLTDSLNYEFEFYFHKTISEHKKEMKRVIDYIKINNNNLINNIKSNEFSKVYFFSDNCSTVDCTLILDVMEKLIAENNNIYYVDSKYLDNKTLLELNKLDSNFSINLYDYNNIYPKVIVTKNGKIYEDYYIKCDGFNCDKYLKNEY